MGQDQQKDRISDMPILREVVYLICQEFTNKEIAEIQNKSSRTIENYRAEIMRLTKSKSSIGIYKYALRSGILEDAALVMKFKAFMDGLSERD